MVELDEYDKKIIMNMQEDASISNKDLAEKNRTCPIFMFIKS
ncbi:MAG: AsnC family protein [Clostridium sp.]|nr:MAG: AsnC family protein [Clostridium sp.]